MAGFFLSCDWGTSNFRIRLVEVNTLHALARFSSAEGISVIHEQWEKENRTEQDRVHFYQQVLLNSIAHLEKELNIPLDHVPVIVSGMASSAIGMIELPYKEVPFRVNGSDLECKTVRRNAAFRHDLIIVSGVRTISDVMRGEETQLVGYMDDRHTGDQLVIIPGTHSKHIAVRDGMVDDFKTYMTGEVFNLLTTKSILSNSVSRTADLQSLPTWRNVFRKGVQDAWTGNMLNDIFSVRTNVLFKKLDKDENYYYLSGLIIGNELKDLNNHTSVVVIGNSFLTELYKAAINIIFDKTEVIIASAEEAVVKGHLKILKIFPAYAHLP